MCSNIIVGCCKNVEDSLIVGVGIRLLMGALDLNEMLVS